VLVLAGNVVERPALVQSTVLSRAAAGALVRLLQALPAVFVDGLARAVAGCAYALGIRRRVTLDNLDHAFPERSAEERRVLARAAYANMARAVVDALRTLGASRSQLLAEVQVEDFGPVERALAAGKGLLVATAHLGSWELFGAAMAQRVPLHAVVRPLRGGVNARLVEARERAGLRLIPARGALSGMVAALRRNEVVAMLVDQAIGGKHALFVPFFGRPAATTPALSMAAVRTGAPTLVVVALREDGRLRFRVEGPFVVGDSGDRQRDLWIHTARVTAALERIIRQTPEQWLWLHRRWKLAPPAEDALRLELLAMDAEDQAVRSELVAEGRLFQGYDPRMETVHRALAGRLDRLVERHGWPGRSVAGEDGAAAAFRIAHHAIATPDLQRRFLALVREAAARGEATHLQAAMLEDRVRQLEGRPSLYGTLLDWDEAGRLSPGSVEAPEQLDARRAALGLPPMVEALQAASTASREPGDRPPADPAARRREFEAWARRVGWRGD
jgi:Kdo2-lipid IVA lauroyltransferase/acyltransferase